MSSTDKISDEEYRENLEAEISRLSQENITLRRLATPTSPKPTEKQSFFSNFFSSGISNKIERVSSDSDLLNKETDKRNDFDQIVSPIDFETPYRNISNKEENVSINNLSYITNLLNQTALMSQQNSLMTNTIVKTNEREEIGIVKQMNDVTVEQIHLFLSKFVPDSKLSAVHQVPKDLRVALAQVLKVPANQSLVNFYKDSIGPDQQFILDLKKHILSAQDFDIVSVISSHKLSKTEEFSLKKLYEMINKCCQEVLIFENVINEQNNLQIKMAIIDNIGPQSFRSYFDKKYKNLIMSDYCSVKRLIEYMEKAITDYSYYIRISNDMGGGSTLGGRALSINTTTTETSTGKTEDKKSPLAPTVDDKSKKKPIILPCWNCGDKNHKVGHCKADCKIHKKQCKNKFNCLRNDRNDKREDSEKNEKAFAVCIESNGNKCSNIYDPGASATASHKVDLFNNDSIVYNKKPKSVEVGNGATIDIAGKGKIGDKEVFFVPELNKTVIATDTTLANGRVNIMIGSKLIILKQDISITEKLIEIEEIAKRNNLVVVQLERQDGLYPMTDDQAKLLCRNDKNAEYINDNFDSKNCVICNHVKSKKSVRWSDDISCYDTCNKRKIEESVKNEGCHLKCNASYFTVENTKLSDQMLFWHRNWNHLSKKDMITVVREKIFKNLPKSLTVKNINKHLPVCESCTKGNMRQKPIPQKSMRVYRAGEYCVGDVKHMTEPDINGNIYMTVFADRGSDMSFVYLHKKLDNLIDLIKDVNNLYKSAGHSMEVLGMDVQFLTKEISAYLKRANLNFEGIEQEFSAPYEHAQNGKAENLIQKLENEIIKVRADCKCPKSFWGPIVQNAVKIRNSLPSKRNPSKSRNEMWGLKKGDLLTTPMIPFGSRVLAHVAAKNQAPLDYKCFETISLGWANGIKGGIILRNLVTSKNIIRRSFKVMGPGTSELYDSTYDVNIEIEEVEDDIEDIDNFESELNSENDSLDRDYIKLNRH